ncbi:AAA family ATPase [Pontibacillus yanchengensis]|uniref:Magnesium chelatase n=1 Tax=Pontibacillus yanchengensis Y32 TaxID=1385514 RepID=A0A0A2T7Z0_9BACI|nr:MoxR family ATPase [Pontibacillus yanchengensis]KGP71892.1 magnesium chelatase [Pontibacillus yanchengensis Y32]
MNQDRKESIKRAREALSSVILGKDEVVELLFTAILAKGHVLLESVPGSGKTKLAKSFAKVLDGSFSRVQFTPDVLPSDVTGIQFYNPKTHEFELRVGPVMTNILLADEINRATPKTQSSLLEVMEEQQTTIDGETMSIPSPFLVIATQNPIESNHGTFPLPEAQLDRFLFKIDMGYPSLAEEKNILTAYRVGEPLEELEATLHTDDILVLQEEVKQVRVSDVVQDYLLALVKETRDHTDIALGISTRGALALMRASQARALLREREFVTPEDVKELATNVFEHRIVLSMEGSIRKTPYQVVYELVDSIEVPVEIGEAT